jgi:signal peptidase II
MIPAEGAPSYLFLAIVSVLTLGIDLGSKQWAEKTLDLRPPMMVVDKYVDFILARNKGGAWGLLQTTSELVRRPFFLLVSALAIGFIVTLFSRLQPRQRALKWGLPLVLGGALGNVFDRIHYGWVIDFIDVHITRGGMEHHWPTFNVADIAICVGVGLMAIDMMLSKRTTKTVAPPAAALEPPSEPPPVAQEPAPEK